MTNWKLNQLEASSQIGHMRGIELMAFDTAGEFAQHWAS